MKLGSVTFNKYVEIKIVAAEPSIAASEYGYVADYSKASYKDSYRATEEFQKELFTGLSVNNSVPDLSTIGQLYITPSCKLPRYKLRDLKEKHNVKVIRDANKADTIVIAKDEISQISKSLYGRYIYKKDEFVNIFTRFLSEPDLAVKITKKNHRLPYSWRTLDSSIIVNYWKKFIDDVKNVDVDYLIASYQIKDKICNLLVTILAENSLMYHYMDTGEGGTGYTDFYEGDDLARMALYSKKNVYTDASFQNLLGESIIDVNQYWFIDELLKNNEESNVEMGLTLMANCNFEQSTPYLMMLVSDHYFGHRHYNYCKSVAFKSLLSYLNYRRYNERFSLDQILDRAKELNLVTDDLKDVIKKRFLDSYNHLFTEHKWVTVSDILIVDPNPFDTTDPKENEEEIEFMEEDDNDL
jgi:hypothetical protein